MSKPQTTSAGPAVRLAMRVEGEFWNAYLVDQDTMEDKVLLGSLRMSLAGNSQIAEAFLNLMKQSLLNIMDEIGAPCIGSEERRAPEHERAGRS